MLLEAAYFFDRVFLENTLRQYSWLLGTLLFVIIFIRFISKIIAKILFWCIRKTSAGGRGELFLNLMLKPLEFFIILHTLYLGFSTLNTPEFLHQTFIGISGRSFLIGVYTLFFILNSAWIASRVADFFITILRYRASLTTDTSDDQLVEFLKDIFKVVIWITAILCVLAIVFSINVTSLVAGAGIAGIAIAFAAQETLQNILGSISIFSEKPFIVGDLVEVDGITGNVERVGFRSTRIRTTDKSSITVPNKNIVNNKLSNLTRRTSRRIQFILALSYDTPEETLRKIIDDIKNYGESHTKKNEETVVALNNFGAYAFEIWVEMYLNYVGWEDYMRDRNEVLFDVLKIVTDNGAMLAYPTNRVLIDNMHTGREKNS